MTHNRREDIKEEEMDFISRFHHYSYQTRDYDFLLVANCTTMNDENVKPNSNYKSTSKHTTKIIKNGEKK